MIHKKFAEIYDDFMSFVNYKTWYKFLISFLPKRKLKVGDLGCGTGNMSYLFAKEGHIVKAFDISDDMLDVANSKYDLDNLEFKKLDVTKDEIGEDYDFLMCNFDTVNYFKDLKSFVSFLELSYKSLKKGGILIFDFVEEGIFDEMFQNDLFVDESKDYTCIMRHEKKSKFKHIVEMVIFARFDDDIYKKYVEIHEKNIFETTKVLEVVRNAGFYIQDSARNSLYGDSRVFLICKKK